MSLISSGRRTSTIRIWSGFANNSSNSARVSTFAWDFGACAFCCPNATVVARSRMNTSFFIFLPSLFFWFLLEKHFHPELDLPRVSCRLNAAKIGVANHRVRCGKRGCIGEVERLHAELSADAFGNLERLVGGQVHIDETRRAEQIPLGVSEGARGVRDKRGSVKPFVYGRIRQVPVTDHVGPVVLAGIRRVGTFRQVDWESRASGHDWIDGPSAEQGVRDAVPAIPKFPIPSEWQFVNGASHKVVRDILAGGGILGSPIERILKSRCVT